jgi:hypothetical protein
MQKYHVVHGMDQPAHGLQDDVLLKLRAVAQRRQQTIIDHGQGAIRRRRWEWYR